MTSLKSNFVSGCIYHVFNRGVGKNEIFADESDYNRFVEDLVIFNDINPPIRISGREKLMNMDRKRERLVDVLAFCLMPNHYHLILRQRLNSGITKFMRKLGDGYVKYFNIKNKRPGTLFQGRFKSVAVQEDRHFNYLPHYLHLNPLDLTLPHWRDRTLKKEDITEAISFLETYKWSSHLDYLGKKNFPEVTTRDIFNEFLEGTGGYKKEFKELINDLDFSLIRDFTPKVILLASSYIAYFIY